MIRHDLTSILRGSPENISVEDLSAELNRLLASETKKQIDTSGLVKSQRIQIFNDIPCDVDNFGFAPVVRTLSEIAFSDATQTPLTLCIDGQWGSGKTSVMQMMEKQARLVGFPCVWLNAWSLEDTKNLISSLAAEIQRESSRWNVPERSFVKYWRQFINASGKALLRWSGTARTILAEFESTSESISDQARDLASIVTARRSFEELVKVMLDAIKHSSGTSDDDPSLSQPRLIVFVDDIDRALPDQIVNMLKTLRLVLDNRYCVFVLGMDFQLVAGSIVNYYSGDVSKLITPEEITIEEDMRGVNSITQSTSYHEEFGRSFLEKLIQLHIRVPQLDRAKVKEYMKTLDLDERVIEIVHWAPDAEVLNPRRLKRYINWLSITLQLIKDCTLPSEISNLIALRALALRRDYWEVYKQANETRPDYIFVPLGHKWAGNAIDVVSRRRFIADQEQQSAQKELYKYLSTFVANIPVFEQSLESNPLIRSTLTTPVASGRVELKQESLLQTKTSQPTISPTTLTLNP